MLVPPETAQGRLGSHITLAAERYLFRREKARAPFEEVLNADFWVLGCELRVDR
jgi:hypothetical protein